MPNPLDNRLGLDVQASGENHEQTGSCPGNIPPPRVHPIRRIWTKSSTSVNTAVWEQSLMEPIGASRNEARERILLMDMVGTRRLELLTSTVSKIPTHMRCVCSSGE